MNKLCLRRSGAVVAVGLGLLLGPAVPARATPTPELRQVGATAVVYQGPQVDVAVSYRFAKLSPKGSWLLLDTSMTSAADPVEIVRGAIEVRTPTGEVVPLASQEDFNQDYHLLAASIARANVTREPMNYLLPHRYRPMRLFADRRLGVVFQSVWLDSRHDDLGRLYFRLPGGVQKGSYELLIKLAKGDVVIPFVI
ncbi:MAG TPA: hypothetical protein PLS53_14250 [Thermoanaerobaculaceae bacterium]|nr:hypothetical protein [Thermoanaerobaculaceae bacterium]HPS79316.1 hypothetical protein [Thermoanaerobaculaceae bacterium]